MKTCKDIMTHKVKYCHPHSTVKEAVKIMEKENCGVVPVVDDDRVVKGIVTDRDIALFVILRDKNPETTRLEEFMNRDVITCSSGENFDELIGKMKHYKIRRIPVVDNRGRLEGMISLGDVAIKVPEEEHAACEALESISAPVHR